MRPKQKLGVAILRTHLTLGFAWNVSTAATGQGVCVGFPFSYITWLTAQSRVIMLPDSGLKNLQGGHGVRSESSHRKPEGGDRAAERGGGADINAALLAHASQVLGF